MQLSSSKVLNKKINLVPKNIILFSKVKVVDRAQPAFWFKYSTAWRAVQGSFSHRHSITCHSAGVKTGWFRVVSSFLFTL